MNRERSGEFVLSQPYNLIVSSHKGGTGRTTTTLYLAWHLARMGLNVRIIDGAASPVIDFVVGCTKPHSKWKNVRVTHSLVNQSQGDVVLIDCPPLSDPSAQLAMSYADGAIVTCMPEHLAIRTIPVATKALLKAKENRPWMRILGVCMTFFDTENPLHQDLAATLESTHSGMILDPLIPFDPALTFWGLDQGKAPPQGEASDAYAELAKALEKKVRARRRRPSLEEAESSEATVMADLDWCEDCGWSLTRKLILEGKAFRELGGGLLCLECRDKTLTGDPC